MVWEGGGVKQNLIVTTAVHGYACSCSAIDVEVKYGGLRRWQQEAETGGGSATRDGELVGEVCKATSRGGVLRHNEPSGSTYWPTSCMPHPIPLGRGRSYGQRLLTHARSERRPRSVPLSRDRFSPLLEWQGALGCLVGDAAGGTSMYVFMMGAFKSLAAH